MLQEHPDYTAEKSHLDDTIKEMKQILQEFEGDSADRTRRMQSAQLLKDEVSSYVHTMMKNYNEFKMCDIKAVMDSPYFGRVDFREDGETEFESFYIGRTKIAHPQIEKSRDILVFDWRDPVATVFYECHGGRANYEVLGRYHYSGDVRLKRRYKIEDGVLQMLFDDYIEGKGSAVQQAMLADPILQDRLLKGAGEKLKDIITSIQDEQNQIIRESPNQIVIIQGVAGSGKSTVGLHRLSYLLYNEKMDPSKMIIIAPNRIFLDYISELLPQIDAADVRQMVWSDLAFLIIGQTYTIIPDERLQLFLSNDRRLMTEKAIVSSTARIKGSSDFQTVLEGYITKKIKKFCLKLEDIKLFDDKLIIGTRQQIDMFLNDAKLPYNERVRVLLQYIRFQIRNYIEVMQSKQRTVKTDPVVEKYRAEGDVFLERLIKKWKTVDLIDDYIGVFKDKTLFKPFKNRNYDLQAAIDRTLNILRDGKIERDDLAPLCSLKYLLDGWRHLQKFSHIVVDEAQDMNNLEFAVLKMLSANGSFTIMGDMSQGIHSYRSIESWKALQKDVFGDDRTVYREIRHSYRSAREIIELFNSVMPAGYSPAIPVYAIGQNPMIDKAQSLQEGISKVINAVKVFQSRGSKSIGILTKREDTSVSVYNEIQLEAAKSQVGDIHLVTGEDASYSGGISVLPIALSKGLEFDAVILWNASSVEFRNNEFDAKLLYVALSRAMHGLYITYIDKLTELIKET
ncbi:HelD family protein [Dendrosporobacter sp. 1207_IL3150]|uniref:HelD family protein n=1 Tax=Dendrosporobacter sp. 1207_IL3150 TaxID=3084054 RepID=UPI002FDA5E13